MTRYTTATAFVAVMLLSGLGACNGPDELRDIERGTDHQPPIENSPIEEGN
ncbi:MAG: hypothetical protein M3277_07185 [Actinomycetota bacterium]|nr:hypothetical protein [Actinomycetota bacterium]